MVKSKVNNKYIVLVIYYLLLVLLFMSWTNMDSVPGGVMRLAFLAALVVPAYMIEKRILPAVMALFLNASTHGYTSSYMPAMMYTYVVLLPAGLALFRPQNISDKRTVLQQLLILLVYVTLVNFVTSFEFQAVSQALIITSCILCYVDFEDERNLHLMSCAFMMAAIMLSYNLIRYGGILNTYTMFNEDRIGFQDINYSACVVSLGCMAAVVELFKNTKDKLILILSIATLVVSIIALSLNASRASLLSIAMTFVVMSVTSKTKIVYKVLVVMVVAYGLYYLYANDYFALLEKRIEMDDSGGGSGRTDIWKIKLDAFFQESNILQFIFGWGYPEGRDLAMSRLKTIGFHNDYLAFLVEYGFIGMILFLRLYLYPMLQAIKKNSNVVIVAALSLGLFIICFTLEPFAAGRVPYYFFFLYIIWWARVSTKSRQIIESSSTNISA